MSEMSSRTAWKINAVLVALGAVAGALIAIPLTYVGKLIAGAPAADIANYVWNMRIMAVAGAIFGPPMAWPTMRSAPLWRAFIEPAVGGLVGVVAGYYIAGSLGFFLGGGLGVAGATWRLHRAFPEPEHLRALGDRPLRDFGRPASPDTGVERISKR
jgi:hypothetical protein